VLLDSLRERQWTIAIMEAGSGGRFGSLLLSEPGTESVVAGTIALAPGTNAAAARELAQSVKETFDSSIGLAITAVSEPLPNGLYEGAIAISVTGAASAEASFPIRAAYQEIQRRSALNAADVLRRALDPSDSPDSGTGPS
jgi:nicotinamide mononucleotide (NMN) deamidase PncC